MADKITQSVKLVEGLKKPVRSEQVIKAINKLAPEWQVLCLDGTYQTLPHSQWISLASGCPSRNKKYALPDKDCNDFAAIFYGWVRQTYWGLNGCGLVLDWGGKHAYNVVIAYNDVLKEVDPLFIEPQHDNELKLNSLPCYNAKGKGLVIL